MHQFKPGTKVTYITDHEKEIGIVKSLSDEKNVFVVYHCNNQWHDYKDYTAARTRLSDLVLGWHQPNREAE